MPCHLTITGAMHRRAETIFCGETDHAPCTGISLRNLTLRCSKHFRAESGPLQVSGSSAKLQVINSSIFDCAATEDGGSLRVMDGALLVMSDSLVQGSCSEGRGGAVAIVGATARVRACSFQACSAQSGGAASSRAASRASTHGTSEAKVKGKKEKNEERAGGSSSAGESGRRSKEPAESSSRAKGKGKDRI